MKLPALTLNQKLGALALALGAVATFSHPQRGPVVKLDTRELALIVQQEVDHVTPVDLAAWIIEGRADYRLIDLRTAREFDSYHIPTAENVPLTALADLQPMPNEKLVLYSEGGIHAAQAWMLLRARGFTSVYTVLLGLDGWKDDVLYPTLAANAGPQERARFERSAMVARFFGGKPHVASESAAAAPLELPETGPAVSQAPALAPPVPGRAGPPAASPRKKKEGC